MVFSQVVISPGIRGGANFAKFTEKDAGFYDLLDPSYDSIPSQDKAHTAYIKDFYIGVFANMRFTKRYALQPEINYSRQGTMMKIGDEEVKYQLTYLSFQAINKLYFNNFNAHAGISLDMLIADKNFNPYRKTNMDLGFILGLGYDITKNIGIEARLKAGLISQMKTTSENHTNMLFQTGVYYTFNGKIIK